MSAQIYEKITKLSQQYGAINLGQGFPIDPLDEEVFTELSNAITVKGLHQYSPTFGLLRLREVISELCYYYGSSRYDPHCEVVVTAGCTEALSSCIFGLRQGRAQVVAFDPYFSYYKSICEIAEVPFSSVPLVLSDNKLSICFSTLEACLAKAPTLLIINNPHNPTGKVFTSSELVAISKLAIKHDAIVVSDEVYQHLVYNSSPASIASFPGMRERTIVVGSISKMLSVTGWRVGWALGPADLIDRVSKVHTNFSFCAPTVLQETVAGVLKSKLGNHGLENIRNIYAKRKDVLCKGLRNAGFHVIQPEGAFYIVSRPPDYFPLKDPLERCIDLITDAGVACLPVTPLFSVSQVFRPFLRFAFCRDVEQLQLAAERLSRFSNSLCTRGKQVISKSTYAT